MSLAITAVPIKLNISSPNFDFLFVFFLLSSNYCNIEACVDLFSSDHNEESEKVTFYLEDLPRSQF